MTTAFSCQSRSTLAPYGPSLSFLCLSSSSNKSSEPFLFTGSFPSALGHVLVSLGKNKPCGWAPFSSCHRVLCAPRYREFSAVHSDVSASSRLLPHAPPVDQAHTQHSPRLSLRGSPDHLQFAESCAPFPCASTQALRGVQHGGCPSQWLSRHHAHRVYFYFCDKYWRSNKSSNVLDPKEVVKEGKRIKSR